MAIHEILEVPDPRLKTVSEPVTAFDADLRALVDDMFETMYAANGIGLAAIQIGVAKRLLVIDLQPEDPDAEPEPCDHDGHHHHHQPTKKEPRVFVNPEILDPSDEQGTYQEGCLSVPDIYADVDRPARCRTRWCFTRPIRVRCFPFRLPGTASSSSSARRLASVSHSLFNSLSDGVSRLAIRA